MAATQGYLGKVMVGAATPTEIGDWSADISHDELDHTSFGDTAKKILPGLQATSGSFNGRFDPTDTNGHLALNTAAISGTSVTLKLYVDATHYYTGSAYLKIGAKASVGGFVEASYSFTGDGAWSYS